VAHQVFNGEIKMTKKWTYGNSWESYPILPGETWQAGEHLVTCNDLFNETAIDWVAKLPDIELLYVDPPWNTSLLKGFRTKANKPQDGKGIQTFLTRMIKVMQVAHAKVNYIELGKQHIDDLEYWIHSAGGKVSGVWNVTYYRKHPSYLLRFQWDDMNQTESPFNYTGKDSDDLPFLAMKAEKPKNVLDICTGRGGTGKHAHYYGIPFYGIELNERRLSVLLEWYAEKGIIPCKK